MRQESAPGPGDPPEARSGQAPAWSDGALATYRAALRSFVARRVADPHEVDDLVQEACARLMSSVRERAVETPQAYLFRIAANLIADRHRRNLPTVPLAEEHHPAVAADQEERRRAADVRAALADALAELSPRVRDVFVLRRFEECSTGEIARDLGISPRMVQKHLTKATAHLYRRLHHLMERGA